VLLLAAKTHTGPDHGVRGLRDRVPGSRATIDVCVPIAIMIIIIIIYDDIIIHLSYLSTAVDHARAYCFRFRIGYPPDGYIAPTDFCFPASHNNIISNRNLEHDALYIVYDYGRRDGFVITNTRRYTAGHTRYIQ